MNHEPFDEHLSSELRSLVADADPPPTLRPGVASARRLPRPLIVGGSIAAAVIAIVALLVSPGSGSHRQRVASEGGTTTTENGTLVPVPGVQSTALPSPASTTTTTPRRASTTLPVIAGKPTTTTTPPPRPLAATHYSLGSGMTPDAGNGTVLSPRAVPAPTARAAAATIRARRLILRPAG